MKQNISSSTWEAHTNSGRVIGLAQFNPDGDMTEYLFYGEALELKDFLNEHFPEEEQ